MVAYPLLAITVTTVLIWVFYVGHNFGPPATRAPRWGSLSYPTNIRDISGGYTQAITRVGGIISAYAFPALLSAVGQQATNGYTPRRPLLLADQLRLMITWSMPTSRAAIQGESGLSDGNRVHSSA
jgi:putative MFS transporter